MMSEWDNLQYAWLMITVALLLLGYVVVYYWKKRTREAFADNVLFEKLAQDRSASKYWIKAVVVSLALICLVFAIMGPKRAGKVRKQNLKGLDLVIALDVSKSMNAEDVLPDRIIKAKKIIKDLTAKLVGDRIGMVVYAGVAHRMMSLTQDYTRLRILLDGINTSMISSQGTSIASAINQSINLFDKNYSGDRVIIILSDGEDHDQDLEQAISNLQKNHTSILTVGIGTKNGGPIPIVDNGTKIGYKKYKGKVVITKLDETSLKRIARKTNGRYIHATSDKDTVRDIQQALLNYKRIYKKTTNYTNYYLYYQYFAFVALLLIIIDSLMLDRKVVWIKKLIK